MKKIEQIEIEKTSASEIAGKERLNRIEQGFFDGRFRPRRVKDKKKHTDKYKARRKKNNKSYE